MIKILVKTGDESREASHNEDVISIGRSSENDIALSDRKVSRKHARIEKVGDQYLVIDLDSGNGIKVNGRDSKTHPLNRGDEIKIGLSTITVLDLDTPVPAPVVAPAVRWRRRRRCAGRGCSRASGRRCPPRYFCPFYRLSIAR